MFSLPLLYSLIVGALRLATMILVILACIKYLRSH